MPIQHCHWIVYPRSPLAQKVSRVAYLTLINRCQGFCKDYVVTELLQHRRSRRFSKKRRSTSTVTIGANKKILFGGELAT